MACLATLTTSTPRRGQWHSITAQFGGDTGITTVPLQAALNQTREHTTSSTVTLASSLNPSTFGASVTSHGDGHGRSNRNRNLPRRRNVLGTGTISGGLATLTTSTLAGGTHSDHGCSPGRYQLQRCGLNPGISGREQGDADRHGERRQPSLRNAKKPAFTSTITGFVNGDTQEAGGYGDHQSDDDGNDGLPCGDRILHHCSSRKSLPRTTTTSSPFVNGTLTVTPQPAGKRRR